MTVNYLIGGSSTLQNELLKLLSGEENKDEVPSQEPQTNSEETVELKEVISNAISKQNQEDAKFVNSDMSGGTNIVGLVENILAGGNLNNPGTNVGTSSGTNVEPNEATTRPEDVISNILVEGGSSEKTVSVDTKNPDEVIKEILLDDKNAAIKGGGEEEEEKTDDDDDDDKRSDDDDETSDEDAETDEEYNSDSSNFENRYIKIISEMRNSGKNSSSSTLTGGNVQSVNRVKVLNMYPWILKSTD